MPWQTEAALDARWLTVFWDVAKQVCASPATFDLHCNER
jgi:hypothetical protein